MTEIREKAMTSIQTISLPVTFPRLRSLLLGLAILGMPLLASAADQVRLRADSPESYTVQEGDTLWDIAGQFLEEPWLWPEVWQINPQIANPDLIYPGDVIELDYVNGSPVLRLSRGEAPTELRTVRLSPQVRREPLLSPIPAIPLDLISSYLSENSVVSAAAFDDSPYLLGERSGHALAATGDEVFGRGEWTPGVITYDIVRRGRDLEDPDNGEMLGVEALFVGSATIDVSNTEEAVLTIDRSVQEIRKGDRLLPRRSEALDSSYLPTPPPYDVDAAIVSIGAGDSIGGMYDTLILNVGTADGIEVGHLLTLQQPVVEMEDDLGETGAWQRTKQVFGFDDSHIAAFPGANIGSVLIYRVFDEASLGLVLKSSDAIRLNDRAVTP